ncbi:MAG TPA: AAA family ATPase [Bryobacteraceae bacterium]|nr:AAA family ATPase [Bryobacteraceae bacterium]
MELKSVTIHNFKALQNIHLTDIPNFVVLVGANGSGKSTLFDVFGFLRDALTGNVRQALDARGRFPEVVTRGHENDTILVELQVDLPIAGRSRLVTYHLEIGLENGRPVVKHEFLRYKRGRYGAPFYFLDFHNGSGFAIRNEEDFDKPDEQLQREEQELESPDILAIKGLGQFQRFRAASALRQLLENWHVSDFHISAARGRKEAIGVAEHLSETGENLPRVAQYLYENHRPIFKTILTRMQERVPGISGVEPELTQDGYLILRFRDGTFKTPFLDRYVSDGTIKMFAYLVLLHDPKPHPLLCIEEPENQLYPSLMSELAEEFRDYARRGGQVMVSTHSPDLLNAVRLEEVLWLIKKDGLSEIRRAQDDPQVKRYMEQGDKMGYLWKQGFFTGVDPA